MLKVSLMALVLLAAPVFAATPLKVENIPDVMQMNNYCWMPDFCMAIA